MNLTLVTLSELKSIYFRKFPTKSLKTIKILRKKLKEAVKIDDFEDNSFDIYTIKAIMNLKHWIVSYITLLRS